MKKKICALDGCDKKFAPQYAWSKYCSPDCAHEAKVRQDYASKCKRKLKTVVRTPAWEKQPKVKWDGVVRDNDHTHKKYVQNQKRLNKYNRRICMTDGCNNRCKGDAYHCGKCIEQCNRISEVFRVDGNYGFEGGKDTWV